MAESLRGVMDSLPADGLAPAVAAENPREVPASAEAEARGLGLQAKIVLFLVIALTSLAALAGLVSALTLRNRMTQDFRSKGEAIAVGLAQSTAELVAAGAAPERLSERLASFSGVEGVAFLSAYDAGGVLLGHTFRGELPAELASLGAGAARAAGPATLLLFDSASGRERRILDLTAPMAGQAGTVRVGMDLDLIQDAATKSTGRFLVLLATLAAVTCLVGYFFARRTVRPVEDLVGVAQRVGRGDLSTLASVSSRDEIGFLARTFNDSIVRLRNLVSTVEGDRDSERRRREGLQNNIREFLQTATQMARGDLTRRGRVTEDALGNVVDAINLVIEELSTTLTQVREAADTVNAGARSMIASTDQIVDGVQLQVQSVGRVNQQVDGVAESVRLVSTNAESSAEAARRTLEAAAKGQAAVADTLDGMMRIRSEVQAISKRIKSLGDRSTEISEIVDTITGISSQTNLLALNAAIEASGAGAEGSRFAVVAAEVRKLAEDTARATKRVAALIRGVQTEVQEAVVAMEEGTRQVEGGFRLANEAGGQLREIATSSQQSASLADQISASTHQQVSGVESVATGVRSISEIAARTEGLVRQGRASADQLLELAGQLNARLARFKLEA